MVKAVETLEILPDIVLIDAVKLDLSVESKSIIHGDALSYAIGCASILAKVSRDRYMARCDEQYPEYGFKKNKGYGTKEHIEAIIKYGVTPLHRAQFVQSAVEHYEQKGGRQ
ncbi:ribonuclease [Acidaminococcus sp. CAG:917]|nr:ribonuclease [Acidaminococcus sp. CAG:917]